MDYGELIITIPSQLLNSNLPTLRETEIIQEPPHKKRKLLDESMQALESKLLAPMIVKVAFSARESIDGIHWVVPRDSNGVGRPDAV